MGQAWSSAGEHVDECDTIVEMVGPLPRGASSRASMRLDATRLYAEAGDELIAALKEFCHDTSGEARAQMVESLTAVQIVTKNAGVVLLKDGGAPSKEVARQVNRAYRRLLPDASNEQLSKWIIGKLTEDIGLKELFTKTRTVLFAPGLKGSNKLPMFLVDLFIDKRTLKRASVYKTLLGIAVVITEVHQKEKGPFSFQRFRHDGCLDGFIHDIRYIKHDEDSEPDTESEAEQKPAARTKSRPCKTAGKIAKQVASPAKGKQQKLPQQQQAPTPSKGGHKRAADGSVKGQPGQPGQSGGHGGQPEVEVGEAPAAKKAKNRRPVQKWTDAERGLLIHFYWQHIKAEKLSWVDATELWCQTFGRDDNAVQLEGNRRHWEKRGFVADDSVCTLCNTGARKEEDAGADDDKVEDGQEQGQGQGQEEQ